MTKSTKNNKKSVLLDPYISPFYYNLHIHPDLLSFTFSGKETIKIKIDKDINKIIHVLIPLHDCYLYFIYQTLQKNKVLTMV